MTNSKKTGRALIASILSIFVCFSVLLSSTFAWFTDSVTSAGNKIVSGTLKADLELLDKESGEWSSIKESESALYNCSAWEPGYTDVKLLKVENEGSLALKWKAIFVSENDLSALADVIDVYVRPYGVLEDDGGVTYPENSNLEGYTPVGTLKEFVNTVETTTYGSLKAGESAYLGIALKMRSEVGNEYQNMSIGGSFDISILATQLTSESDSFGNDYDADAEYPSFTDSWDGTSDTSWYNSDADRFVLNTAEQLAGLGELVDAGNDFSGKSIILNSDIDLYIMGEDGEPVSFSPIGDVEPFRGTFDGNGHEVQNLYQSGWVFGYEWGSYGSIGFFGQLDDATVKNLTVSGAEAFVEGGDVGGITGSATGKCTFENITIKDSDFGTYNNGIGGIIGWSGEGEYTFKNVNIESDVVLGGLWGSFDSSIGGVVGQGEPGATYNFENVNVACRLDAYNDVIAAYKYYIYRMTGMLIGRLEETTQIDGANYPDMSKYNINCTNVTVTYGDWVDYHYCVVEGKTAWRVEPGYQYGGVPADHDHSTCVMHHNESLPFEGLFGGDQYGVRPILEYSGVTVVKSNDLTNE